MPQPMLEPPATDYQYQYEFGEIDTDDFGTSLIEDYVEMVEVLDAQSYAARVANHRPRKADRSSRKSGQHRRERKTLPRFGFSARDMLTLLICTIGLIVVFIVFAIPGSLSSNFEVKPGNAASRSDPCTPSLNCASDIKSDSPTGKSTSYNAVSDDSANTNSTGSKSRPKDR